MCACVCVCLCRYYLCCVSLLLKRFICSDLELFRYTWTFEGASHE